MINKYFNQSILFLYSTISISFYLFNQYLFNHYQFLSEEENIREEDDEIELNKIS